MRVFRAVILVICALALPARGHALGLKFCNDVEDDHARMACLQEHISALEETVVALSGRITTLEHDLESKVAMDATYKLRSVTQGKCLSLSADNQAPIQVGCDSPDSWTLLAGAPIKKDKPAAPTATPPVSPPSVASGSDSKATNPCKGLSPVGCAAKSERCEWKADKNKCGRK